MPSKHLILCCPLLLPSQHQGLFQWVGFSHQVAKVRASVSASVLPMNIQDWLLWSPCTPRVSQESSPATQFESINSLVICLFYCPTLNPYMTTEMPIALPIWTFVSKVTSLLFSTLSRFVIAFLPRRKEAYLLLLHKGRIYPHDLPLLMLILSFKCRVFQVSPLWS